MDAAALVVLDGAAAYLILLGLAAVIRRDLAIGFLDNFAQTSRANWIEALCRFAVGLAFMQLAPELPASRAMVVLGGFLAVTAIALVLFPTAHRRFANMVMPAIERLVPLIGLVALLAGTGLASLLWPLHGMIGFAGV